MVEQDKSQVYVYHDGKFDMMRQSTVHSGYMHGLGTDASSCLYPEHAYKRS